MCPKNSETSSQGIQPHQVTQSSTCQKHTCYFSNVLRFFTDLNKTKTKVFTDLCLSIRSDFDDFGTIRKPFESAFEWYRNHQNLSNIKVFTNVTVTAKK